MKNKSKKNTNINKDEDNLLNMYIEENKNIKSDTPISTPCAKLLEDSKKKQLQLKLKTAIQSKNNLRYRPDKKLMSEQTESVKNMMKHPKMNQHILELYAKAVTVDLTKTLPNPIEIFDDTNKYKKLYYQYILELLNKMKEDKLDIKYLDKLLDNPYGHYMSKCLDCPLNPFNKN
jgi:hypothetical protein